VDNLVERSRKTSEQILELIRHEVSAQLSKIDATALETLAGQVSDLLKRSAAAGRSATADAAAHAAKGAQAAKDAAEKVAPSVAKKTKMAKKKATTSAPAQRAEAKKAAAKTVATKKAPTATKAPANKAPAKKAPTAKKAAPTVTPVTPDTPDTPDLPDATAPAAPSEPAGSPATSVGKFTQAEDSYGYRWLLLDDPDIEDLVTRVHLANSTLSDAGWGPQLLCSVFAFKPGDGAAPDAKSFFLVYLFKRGTFYPFAPLSGEHRDNELELRIKAIVGADLPFEADLSRWFPLWDSPVR